eukprot:7214787-Prymnesium_polylepis.1
MCEHGAGDPHVSSRIARLWTLAVESANLMIEVPCRLAPRSHVSELQAELARVSRRSSTCGC